MASKSKLRRTIHACDDCQKEFASKSNLNTHRKVHLIKKDFKCSFCEYVTNFKHNLFDHIRTHTKERPYKCPWPSCNSAFSNPKAVDLHHRRTHQKDDDSLEKFQCPTCLYTTDNKSRLKCHLKIHSDIKEFSCPLCPFETKLKKNIKRHHESVHLKLKPFKCQHSNCTWAFSEKSQLKNHQLVHNKNDESRLKFRCSECPYKTGSKFCLKLHSKTHSEDKPFACDLCPFRSKHGQSMQRHHKIVHSTVKPFKCPEPNCSYSAKQISNLNGHIKVHADYKEFACTFPSCVFRAKWKSQIKAHEMTHRGEKPFECNFCSFKCTQSGGLCVHIRYHHTGEAPYPCSSCSYRGKSKSSLSKHVKRRHFGKQC